MRDSRRKNAAFRGCVRLLKVILSMTVLGMVAGQIAAAQPIVLSTSNVVPTAYLVDGTLTGSLVDIVVEAFRRAGYPVEIRLLPLARSQAQVRTGEIDGMFALFKTPEREAFFDYSSEAMMFETQSFFVRTGSPILFDGDLTKIAKNKVGINNGSSHGVVLNQALEDGSFPDVERVSGLDSLLKMLTAGRLDVITSSREAIWAAAAHLRLQNDIRELSPPTSVEPSYLVFTRARDMSEVKRDFTLALKSMKEDGSYDKIVARYP